MENHILKNQIYLGNCLELLKQVPDKSIDMILCDPPYGTTKEPFDKPLNLELLWKEYKRVIKDNGAILLFAQTPYDKILGTSNLPMLRYEWIWEKTEATGFFNAKKMPLKAHENILVFYKKLPVYNPQFTTGHKPVNSFVKRIEVANKSAIYGNNTKEIKGGGTTKRYPRSVLRFSTDKQKEHYINFQKPIALCEYMIKTYTNVGDTVLDNCCGSGSTCVACIHLDRNYIGMELNPDNYNIAVERCATAERKKKNV